MSDIHNRTRCCIFLDANLNLWHGEGGEGVVHYTDLGIMVVLDGNNPFQLHT